jgi:fused signal recognition particle receptor
MAIWKPFSKKAAASPEPAKSPPPHDTQMPAEPAAEAPPGDAEPAQKAGLFGRFRQAVRKTVAVLNTDIRDLVGVEGRLVDDEFLEELFAHLVKTDMGVGPASKVRDAVGRKHRARKVTMQQLAESAREVIREVMAQESAELRMAASGPTVIMVVGVNGSGKTTSIAKLAWMFKHEGKSVVLGAGDTFRAAAVEQLKIWADRLDVEFVSGKAGGDPAAVAFKATERAAETGADVCIIDTAGRLQTQTNLMDQLGKIRRVIGKIIPDAPHEVLLVLDATAGQNALSQAKGFSAAAGCTGIVLAKLDGTARGGVAIPIRQEFGLPVKFIGIGETPDALAPFRVDYYVNALFDLN